MQVTVDKKIVFRLIDTLLARWTAEPKKYPYNRPDAIIPQYLIPGEIRARKETLACFYFYICIYMRGGIESAQAFNAMIRMWREHPTMFDPIHAQWSTPAELQPILKKYVGWDSHAASVNWVENSRRLMRHWEGNPLNLLKGLRNYDEALRRIRNKLQKGDQRKARLDGRGFRGFQPKMVSMLIYFYDWERWLEKRFLYPAPADFHNFRLGLNQGAIIVSDCDDGFVRSSEKLSAPWREAVMDYLKARKADPIEVADAIWMYSLVMCGNSPLMNEREAKPKVKKKGSRILEPLPEMFEAARLPHRVDEASHQHIGRFRRALKETCLRCVIAKTCTLAIPSRPYYRKGKLILRPRPKVEGHFGVISPDTIVRPIQKPRKEAQQTHTLIPDE
jgi:hypothetical protein